MARQASDSTIRRQIYLAKESGTLFYQRDRALMWASDTHGHFADAFHVLAEKGVKTTVTCVAFLRSLKSLESSVCLSFGAFTNACSVLG